MGPGLGLIDLSNNLLSGTVPKELADLDIYRLDLSNNNLHGSIPPEFGRIEGLRYLYLHDNQITGQIPDELSTLIDLESLRLSNSRLTGTIPEVIGNLVYLEELDLSNNQLSGNVPPELGNIRYRHECLRYSEGKYSPPLGLRYLSLAYNELGGPIPHSLGAASLEHLDLSNNHLTGHIPDDIGGLVYLEHVDLSNNELNGTIPSEFGQITERNVCRQNLEGFTRCRAVPGIVYLSLAHNNLSGPIPPNLGNLANLERLDLQRNHLTGELPPTLEELANVEDLDLSSNRFTGELPALLASLEALTALDLSSNRYRGAIGPELVNLSNLESLNLSDNMLSGPIPRDLGSISSLELLHLGANRLDGPIPAELGALEHLESLDLSHNRLSGVIPADLAALRQLRRVDLSHNFLASPIPKWLGTLPNLSSLDLRTNLFALPWPMNLETSRPGLVVNLPVPPETMELIGPSYASVGTPLGFSLPDVPAEIIATRWDVTPLRTAQASATGEDPEFRFVPTHGGSFRVSAVVVGEDGTTIAGSAKLIVLDDIADGEFVDQIIWLAHRGITLGCGPYSFCPDRVTTRGQMAAFLSRALDLPPAEEDHFSDDTGSVFEDDINRLADAGIAHECTPRWFCHDRPLTRGQLAGFMAAAVNLADDPSDDYFSDDTGSVFEDDINRFAETGMLDGCATNLFCPDGTITREQVAGLLYKGSDLIAHARRR